MRIKLWFLLLILVHLQEGTSVSTVLTFQAGVFPNSAVDDISIYEQGDVANGTEPQLVIDNQPMVRSLVRFRDFIGCDPAQVPPGAQIHLATLEMHVTNAGNPGDCPILHAVFEPWLVTNVTWRYPWSQNGADPPASSTYGEAFTECSTMFSSEQVDVTNSVQAWVNGSIPNLGWCLFQPLNNDGIDYSSSEHGTLSEHPKLTVNFTGSANCQTSQPSSAPTLLPSSAAPSVAASTMSPTGSPTPVSFSGTVSSNTTFSGQDLVIFGTVVVESGFQVTVINGSLSFNPNALLQVGDGVPGVVVSGTASLSGGQLRIYLSGELSRDSSFLVTVLEASGGFTGTLSNITAFAGSQQLGSCEELVVQPSSGSPSTLLQIQIAVVQVQGCGGLSIAALAGIIAGTVVIALVLIIIMAVCVRKRHQHMAENHARELAQKAMY